MKTERTKRGRGRERDRVHMLACVERKASKKEKSTQVDDGMIHMFVLPVHMFVFVHKHMTCLYHGAYVCVISTYACICIARRKGVEKDCRRKR